MPIHNIQKTHKRVRVGKTLELWITIPNTETVYFLLCLETKCLKGRKQKPNQGKEEAGVLDGGDREPSTQCGLHWPSCKQKTDANFTLYLCPQKSVPSVVQNSHSWVSWTDPCLALSLEETLSHCRPTALILHLRQGPRQLCFPVYFLQLPLISTPCWGFVCDGYEIMFVMKLPK